jgi:hypothetical protein
MPEHMRRHMLGHLRFAYGPRQRLLNSTIVNLVTAELMHIRVASLSRQRFTLRSFPWSLPIFAPLTFANDQLLSVKVQVVEVVKPPVTAGIFNKIHYLDRYSNRNVFIVRLPYFARRIATALISSGLQV